MKILILDNYDSFTYNLYHYLQCFSEHIDVYRNDEIDLLSIDKYDAVVLSPGPGLPHEAGITLDLIKTYYTKKKILGICLGHQSIAVAFGGKLKNLNNVLHGVVRPTVTTENQDVIFKNLPKKFDCGRYHSWAVDSNFFPDCLIATSVDSDGEIMSLRHFKYDVVGLQFHPESIMTHYGKQILENWVKGC